ncbi:hypothetical protein HK405_015916, partial [Cladochytrium tenue]
MPLMTTLTAVAERFFERNLHAHSSPARGTPSLLSSTAAAAAAADASQTPFTADATPSKRAAQRRLGELLADQPHQQQHQTGSASPTQAPSSLTGSPVPGSSAATIDVALRETLIALINKLSLPLFCIDPPIPGAPIEYYSITESPLFTLGLLILKRGQTLPIHDHPGMSVFTKVIFGDLHVRQYELLDDDDDTDSGVQQPAGDASATADPPPLPPARARRARLACDRLVSASDGPDSSLLTISPDSAVNLHSLSAHSEYVVLLDLLGPPYDEVERPCTYYSDPVPLHAAPPPPPQSRSRRRKQMRRRKKKPPPAALPPDAAGDGDNDIEGPTPLAIDDDADGEDDDDANTPATPGSPSPAPPSSFSLSTSAATPQPQPYPASTPPPAACTCGLRALPTSSSSSSAGGAVLLLPPLPGGADSDAVAVIGRPYRGAGVIATDMARARAARDEALVKLGRGVAAVWSSLV